MSDESIKQQQDQTEADEYQDYRRTPWVYYTGGRTGPATEGRPIAFRGRLIANGTDAGSDDISGTTWRVFQTVGGRIVVETDSWSRLEGGRNERMVEVFDCLAEVPGWPTDEDWRIGRRPKPGAIPDSVRIKAQEALGIDPAIYVD